MSNRAATTLALAAVISSLCLYGTVAQVPERPAPADGAIVVGQPAPGQELPGRFQAGALGQSSVFVIDTHTSQCWSKIIGQSSWRDLGSAVEQK